MDVAETKTPQPASSPQRSATGQFKLGHTGMGGRPRGSRAQYAQHFTVDFYEDWVQYGRAAIAAVRKKSPVDYLRAAVAILPKDVNVNVSVVESMNDDELSATIRRLSADLRAEEAIVCGDVDRTSETHRSHEAIPILPISETS